MNFVRANSEASAVMRHMPLHFTMQLWTNILCEECLLFGDALIVGLMHQSMFSARGNCQYICVCANLKHYRKQDQKDSSYASGHSCTFFDWISISITKVSTRSQNDTARKLRSIPDGDDCHPNPSACNTVTILLLLCE